jgi:hypothetical protein
MIIWRMRFACRTPKATNVRSQYVIFIDFRCNNSYKNS